MRERDLKALEFDKIIGLIAAMAASEPGRNALMQLKPSTDAGEVRERLRATAEMAELRSHSGPLPIQEFNDQQHYLLVAEREGSVLDGVSLLRIRDFVLAARHVGAFLRPRMESLPHLGALTQKLAAPKELADALMGALADDGGLLDDASHELKRLRTRLRDERMELEARLARQLNLPGIEPIVSDYLVTIRNRRFVLPLKLNYAERLEGIVQDRSVSGETLFVEPMWAVDLNNRLMMLEREAEAEEQRILAHLTAMVRGYVPELRMTFEAMVALDALNARAIFADRFGCVEPEIGEIGIELQAARHPLLTISGREVVPIDIKIGPEQRGIVISGPNTGGKTVALKTLGLLSLLAQAGVLIPAAAGSRVTVFRSVFADIGDEQSIEASLSSFAAHIVNLTEIVGSLAEPALIILDDPAVGTDPGEGAALVIGLMNHLSGRRCVVAIATHSMAVKLHAYSQAGFEAVAVDFDAERLVPLYRLRPHTVGQSYGLAIAQRLGLPEQIIRLAKEALPAGSAELEKALNRLEAERVRLNAEAEKVRERERLFAEREREALDAAARAGERADAERRRLRTEGEALIAELRREGSRLLQEVKTRAKSRPELSSFLAEATRKLDRKAPAAAQRAEAGEALKVGDQVEFGDLRGELLVLEPARAVVARGGLRIEVSPERLRRVPSPPPGARTPRVTVSAAASEQGELNLIGMRAAEALRKLEQFLDQAYLTNRSEVRILHGIGSGALKKAVHEYLSSSPYCASFRQAEPHQGGAGATVVELSL